MKHIKHTEIRMDATIFFMTALLFFPYYHTHAQTPISRQFYFNQNDGTSVVLRENNSGTPIMAYRKTTPPSGLHFVYGDWYTGAAESFSILDYVTPDQTSYSYQISDMRVVGNMCYFCGKCIMQQTIVGPESDMITSIIDSTGILGRFPLSPSGFQGQAKYNLIVLDGTKSLKRMAAYCNSDGDTLIAMTGVADVAGLPSCITVARILNTSTTWKYNVWYKGDSEIFTDITSSYKSIVIASRRTYVSEEKYFHLRHSYRFDLLQDNYSSFDTRYPFSPGTLFPTTNGFSFVRPSNADVHICSLPWKNYVYVAYCGTSNLLIGGYPTALCQVGIPSMEMSDMQVVKKCYSDPHSLIDICYQYDTYYDECNSTVALLHRAEDPYKTAVEYPKALVSAYSGTPIILVQQLQDNLMQSLSIYNGNNVRLGGVWSPNSSNLTHFQEIKPPTMGKNICIYNSLAEVECSNKTQCPIGVLDNLNKKYINMRDLIWGDMYTVSTQDVDGVVTCSY